MTSPLAPLGTLFAAEDDDGVRALLARIAASIGLVAETFARAEELLARAPFPVPSVVVLDLRLPGLGGLEAQQQLIAAHNDAPVVFLTGFGDVASASTALKSGAFDFLEKPFREERLVEVLQSALAFHAVTAKRSEERRAARQRLDRLTPREREVLPLLLEGLASKAIAAELKLSKKTIDLHRSNVLHKVGVGSTAELVRLVLAAEDEAALRRS
ncbi:MAG: response regulator transcription factor [Planctomycetes bacterium]|nr:response regulator transcription factor [Planctomycetota bacterium]